MASFLEDVIDETLEDKCERIINKIDSEMHFKSNYSGKILSFEWLDEIEKACPYIDVIVRIPKVALVRDEQVVEINRAKKVNVDSVKHLVKHTNLISKINDNNDIEPSKILDIRNEETFNIYENRFLYTLINDITKFIMEQEELIKELDLKNSKLLEYVADVKLAEEKVHMEVKVTSNDVSSDKQLADKNFKKKLKSVKLRIKRIKEYIFSWNRSEMVKELERAHVSMIKMPIKKTNLILKNPNFQEAVRLFEYLYNYHLNDNDKNKNDLDSDGDDLVKAYLDHAMLINYSVLDSMSRKKREQKEKIKKYAILILQQQIKQTLDLFIKSGVEISEQELLGIIAQEMKAEKDNRLVGADDVKKKFKSAMDEYLERMQENL